MKLNKSIPSTLALIVALALPSLSTAAPAPQDNGNNNAVATLKIGGGVIMTSQDGAPFVSGTDGQSLYSQERLMVSSNSSATVVYNDGCRQTYDKPGVYTISANCKAAVLVNGGSRPIGVFVAGAVVTGGLVGRVLTKNAPHIPPVSH